MSMFDALDEVIEAPLEGRQIERAQQAHARIESLLSFVEPEQVVALHADDAAVSLEVPAAALYLFRDVLAHLARGDAVRVVPVHAELTTQQAADLLNVSRPFVVKLMEEKKLPFHRVGTHRRVRVQDVLEYKRADDAMRREVLDQLAVEAEKLGLE
jgi:excisionase family DNA binding protein